MVKVYSAAESQVPHNLQLIVWAFILVLTLTGTFQQAYAKDPDPIVINTKTTINNDYSIETNGTLIVQDTLIVYGKMTMGTDANLFIEDGGVVIIYGDLYTNNKVSLAINSYLIVLGSLVHTSNSGMESATVSEDAHVYIFGDFDPAFNDTELGCPSDTDYDHGTISECGHGELDDFIDNESENPILEIVSQDKLRMTPTAGILCPPASVSLIIQDFNITQIHWYKNDVKISEQSYYPFPATTTGVYYARYEVEGSRWYITNAVTVIDGSFNITTHPSTTSQSVCQGGVLNPLSVETSKSGLSYQWYSNTTASNSGGSVISGATSSSFTPTATSTGNTYYYCVVTGSCGSTTSNVSGAFIVSPQVHTNQISIIP